MKKYSITFGFSITVGREDRPDAGDEGFGGEGAGGAHGHEADEESQAELDFDW